MDRFPLPLLVRWDGPRLWRLTAPFVFLSDHVGKIEVPVGFDTDLASVPKFARWFASVDGPWTPAAVIHDYLYVRQSVANYGHVDRKMADAVFLEGMAALGVPAYKRWAMWAAVRVGGGRTYRDD